MILKKQIQPHVYSIQESNTVNRYLLQHFGADMEDLERNNALNQLEGLLDTFTDAKEYGSILNVADITFYFYLFPYLFNRFSCLLTSRMYLSGKNPFPRK